MELTDKQADAGADNLPPLPAPAHRGPDGTGSYFDSYTAEQVRQAQREARDAEREHNMARIKHLTYERDCARAVIRGGVVDLIQLHKAFGLPDDEIIDIDKMIERLAALRAQQPAPQASEDLPPIEYDKVMDRTYIPLPGGWEIQTKGKGSSFRIAHIGSSTRWIVMDDRLHEPLEALARDLRAELASRGASQGRNTKQNSVSNSSSNCTSEVAAQALDMGVEVKVERGRVWIVRGNQSFMLAYVPDEGDDPAEIQAYADNLRSALSIITPCVKSENLALDMGNRPASIGSIGDYTEFHRLLNAFTEAAKALDEATGKDVFDAADKFSAAQTALISYIDAWAARRAVPEVVQQALDIALDLAMAEADNVHKTYAGYKQHKHDAADRDVETIKRAIDVINQAAASVTGDVK